VGEGYVVDGCTRSRNIRRFAQEIRLAAVPLGLSGIGVARHLARVALGLRARMAIVRDRQGAG
jgi:hypothetical protein